MSSIRSVLIKSSMANIQKEMNQLEHWLHNLPDERCEPKLDTNNILLKLSEQLSHQQFAINNILERIDSIEGNKVPHRNVFIDGYCEPFDVDNCELLKEVDKPDVKVVVVKEVQAESDVVDEAEVVSEDEAEAEVVSEDEVEEVKVQAKVEVVSEVKEVEGEVVSEDEVEVEEEEGEVVDEEVKVEEGEAEVEAEVEAEAEAEAEAEELELEEFEYKNVTYYKDADNFVYSIINDEPSENPIGFWKEKSKMIAFYKNI